MILEITDKMRFTYLKTPIHRYTFSSRRIRDWVEVNSFGRCLNLFAGETKLSINEVRNDIREDALADYHLDALRFCESWQGEKFDTIILDPPYSYRKSMEFYAGKVQSPFNAMKDEICRIINKGGVVISFGYTSVCMGVNRSFVLEHVLLIHHGGAIHDTIASIERQQFILL